MCVPVLSHCPAGHLGYCADTDERGLCQDGHRHSKQWAMSSHPDTWTWKQVRTHTLSDNTCAHTHTHKQPIPHHLCLRALTDWDMLVRQNHKLINCHLEMNFNSKSAVFHWAWLAAWGIICVGWRASIGAHLPPVNANREIRAAGGGPEVRVAVHVKHQQAWVERVKDDSTCVLQRNMRANVF